MTRRWGRRVGGAAAMLVAGGVIGLGTAATSSAEPTDAATGPAAEASSVPRGVSATQRTSRPSPRGHSAAAAGRRVPQPAAARKPGSAAKAAVSTRAIPEPEPTGLQPAVEPAAKPTAAPLPKPSVAVTGPAPTPPPTAPAARTAAVRGLVNCDPRGRKITVFKGVHFVVPNKWGIWIKKVSGDATFTADSAYDLKDADQYDWNKLAGITYTPWRPERNAAMVVWRYNIKDNTYEVGPFFDNDFAYVFPTDAEVITVPADRTFTYSVDYTGITVSDGDRTVFKPYPDDLQPTFWTSARVTGWFGGSEVAPRTLTYYLHMR